MSYVRFHTVSIEIQHDLYMLIVLNRVIRAIDNMIMMLEVHTQQLEETAFQRNREFYEQKARAEDLLYSILPR